MPLPQWLRVPMVWSGVGWPSLSAVPGCHREWCVDVCTMWWQFGANSATTMQMRREACWNEAVRLLWMATGQCCDVTMLLYEEVTSYELVSRL